MDTLLLHPENARERARAVAIAAELLCKGEVVAFPTETVYGLGANIFNDRALRAVFRAKGRPADNPLIVHVASLTQAGELARRIPPRAHVLMEHCWPGPLTLVLHRMPALSDVVTAGLETVALRMPAHRLALDLIRAAGVPLAAPSANRSGRPSPTDATHVVTQLSGRIAAILDGGPCPVGIESTVLDLTSSRPRILRPGGVTGAQIEDILGTRVVHARPYAERPAAPGMKYTHYAPAHPLHVFVHDDTSDALRRRLARFVARRHSLGERVGIMAPSSWRREIDADAFFSSGSGTSADLARVMYRGLHELDDAGVDVICCPGVPESGLGLAVMNRLRKAATKVEG